MVKFETSQFYVNGSVGSGRGRERTYKIRFGRQISQGQPWKPLKSTPFL